jgi:branched-chain amino acid transport system permease protein
VALVLFWLMIGVSTEAGPEGQLIYWTRFGDLAAIVAAVFFGSIVVELLRANGSGGIGAAGSLIPANRSTQRRRKPRPFHRARAADLRLLVPVIFYDQRLLDLGILVLTYVMLGWGLNIVVGLAGLLDLGYVAFYAVGAYSYALLSTTFGCRFWICLPLGGILAALLGRTARLSRAAPAGRLSRHRHAGLRRDHPLVLLNWQHVTGGPNGITGIPRPSFFGLPLTAHGGRRLRATASASNSRRRTAWCSCSI